MQSDAAAGCLESLGNTTRLELFRLLVRAGAPGMAVGELQAQLDIPGSTLTHHLQHLVQRELVTQQREGRVLRCCANFATMTTLLAFLTDECCAGDPAGC
ncbi:MAG: helix-turn-helix transcriptional regulator [Pseudomonadota bacterium]